MRPPPSLAGPVGGRLDERRRAVGVRRAGTDTGSAARPLAAAASHSSTSRRWAGVDEVGERPRPASSPAGSSGQLDRLGVAAPHEAVVVDREHALGQVVEQEAQLGLGVDQPVDRVVEVAGDAARLQPRHDDGGDREQRRRDDGGDRARRAVALQAQHERDEADEQRGGDGDRQHPPPHRRPATDGDAVGHVIEHRPEPTPHVRVRDRASPPSARSLRRRPGGSAGVRHHSSRRATIASSAELALVEADLEEVGQRLPDQRARADAEVLHHLAAVELGPDRGQLLGLGQLGDARLEVVHPLRQPGRLLRVAGRAVARGSAR